jgi:predicted site-specific integrase-resolvase|tara:strand:- start:4238 stop:4489 length:252 start_codon:yes stop_codon:yes gene_type:complete
VKKIKKQGVENARSKLTVREVAKREQVSARTVQIWVRDGVIPPEACYKHRRVIRISPDYEQYLHQAPKVFRARRGQNKEELSA